MRIITPILFIAVIAFSCSKKTAPAKSDTANQPAVAEQPAAPTPPAAPVPSAEVTAGKTLFEAKCGRCHGLKPVENYTQERWTGIMERMAPKARLTDDEKKQVLAYVHFYAKK